MPAVAVVPTDSLMPLSTRGFVSIDDINTLSENWRQTQLGQLVQDESMRPFVEDMKAQLQRKFAGIREKLGLEFSDLKNIAGGEIGLGFVEREGDRAAVVLAVDTTDRGEETQDLLRQIDRNLSKRGATRSEAKSADTTLTIYNIPPQRENGIAHEAVYFVKDNMLCASDSRIEIEEMLHRFDRQPGGRLVDYKPYQETMRRCAAEAGRLQPEMRWFLDPFGYARAVRSMASADTKRHGKDIVKILSTQGFDAVQGFGGYLNLSVSGTFELLHRTAVYAPAVKQTQSIKSKDKYHLAMRMMELPNGNNLSPQTWLPRKLATYRSFNWDMQSAFDYFDTLFDAFAGYEEAFDGVLEGLERDPYGPQVDVRRDFVSHLGQRVTVITDYQLPITTKSERFCFMVEILDEEAIAKTLEKFMKSDPNAYCRDFEGTPIWEIIEAEEEVIELDLSIPDLDPLASADEEVAEAEDRVIPTSAVCVSNGHLMIASHIDFLTTVLEHKQSHNSLASAGDYHEVEIALKQLMGEPSSVRCFLRTDEAYRPTYELLRQGKMPESETLLGRLLNRLLTPPEDEDEGVLRQQKIDGRKLPAFEMVRRYFNPAGMLVRSDRDGWFIVGATLSKQLPQARAGAKPSASRSAMR